MALNINDFISNAGSPASSALFRVQILNPVDATADLKAPFMIKAASVPASNLGTAEIPYMGRKIKVAGDRTFEPWNVTVINDEENTVRNAFEVWSDSINGKETNTRHFINSSPSLYKSQAQISMLSRTGKVLRVYNFVGLWPANVAAIDLDWSNSDSIQEFQCTLEYDYFEVIGGDTGTGSVISN